MLEFPCYRGWRRNAKPGITRMGMWRRAIAEGQVPSPPTGVRGHLVIPPVSSSPLGPGVTRIPRLGLAPATRDRTAPPRRIRYASSTKCTKPAGRLAPRVLSPAEAGGHTCQVIRRIGTDARRVKNSFEGVPEAGLEPARRFRHTLDRCTRLPISPFGHVRENGETEKRPDKSLLAPSTPR